MPEKVDTLIYEVKVDARTAEQGIRAVEQKLADLRKKIEQAAIKVTLKIEDSHLRSVASSIEQKLRIKPIPITLDIRAAEQQIQKIQQMAASVTGGTRNTAVPTAPGELFRSTSSAAGVSAGSGAFGVFLGSALGSGLGYMAGGGFGTGVSDPASVMSTALSGPRPMRRISAPVATAADMGFNSAPGLRLAAAGRPAPFPRLVAEPAAPRDASTGANSSGSNANTRAMEEAFNRVATAAQAAASALAAIGNGGGGSGEGGGGGSGGGSGGGKGGSGKRRAGGRGRGKGTGEDEDKGFFAGFNPYAAAAGAAYALADSYVKVGAADTAYGMSVVSSRGDHATQLRAQAKRESDMWGAWPLVGGIAAGSREQTFHGQELAEFDATKEERDRDERVRMLANQGQVSSANVERLNLSGNYQDSVRAVGLNAAQQGRETKLKFSETRRKQDDWFKAEIQNLNTLASMPNSPKDLTDQMAGDIALRQNDAHRRIGIEEAEENAANSGRNAAILGKMGRERAAGFSSLDSSTRASGLINTNTLGHAEEMIRGKYEPLMIQNMNDPGMLRKLAGARNAERGALRQGYNFETGDLAGYNAAGQNDVEAARLSAGNMSYAAGHASNRAERGRLNTAMAAELRKIDMRDPDQASRSDEIREKYRQMAAKTEASDQHLTAELGAQRSLGLRMANASQKSLMGEGLAGATDAINAQADNAAFLHPELKRSINAQRSVDLSGAQINSKLGRIGIAVGTQSIVNQNEQQGFLNQGNPLAAEAAGIVSNAALAIKQANIEFRGDDNKVERQNRVKAINESVKLGLKGIDERVRYSGGAEQVSSYLSRGNLNAQSSSDMANLAGIQAGANKKLADADKQTDLGGGKTLNDLATILDKIAQNIGVVP